MRQTVRYPHSGCIRNHERSVDADSSMLRRLSLHPSQDVVRMGEAIESRQMQRAAVPIEGCNAAGLALPTEVNSQEAQKPLF
jgi:hypothetical protein